MLEESGTEVQGQKGWMISSQNVIVTGVTNMNASLPEHSIMVCGTITDRFSDVVSPLEDNYDNPVFDQEFNISQGPNFPTPSSSLPQAVVYGDSENDQGGLADTMTYSTSNDLEGDYGRQLLEGRALLPDSHDSSSSSNTLSDEQMMMLLPNETPETLRRRV